MRGKVFLPIFGAIFLGITPAYAGKSKSSYSNLKRSRDHPRLCGEKFSSNHSPKVWEGSPPPMRGKAKFALD